MCDPIIIGVATGLMSAVQSIAGYQAQSQAASASEKAYQEQRNLNQEAANRAYQQTQLKMKGEMEKASQQAEQGLVRRLQAQGTTLAAGRTGQSIGGLLADAERVEGKDLGALGMNLAYAQQDYFFGMENIYTQQKTANIQAASQRTAKPSAGWVGAGSCWFCWFLVFKLAWLLRLRQPEVVVLEAVEVWQLEVADLLIHPLDGVQIQELVKSN
jgi:hypothetical protein